LPLVACTCHWAIHLLYMNMSPHLKHVVPNGLHVVYGIRYKPGGAVGITIIKSDIMLIQFLSNRLRFAHMLDVADIVKGRMADIGAQVSCTMASPFSSTSAASKELAMGE